MMDVFILTSEPLGVAGDIVGVYKEADVARKMFNDYLNTLESEWRLQDGGKINEHNTFNRFSEPSGNVILSATCDSSEVFVKKFTVE
jgi:hypothetical protein